MSDEKRFVRNRTDQPVFVKGHGVIQPGKEPVEVTTSDAVEAAIEEKVLAEAAAPEPEPDQGASKTRRNAADKDKEGGQ